jgi:hypothetical protein
MKTNSQLKTRAQMFAKVRAKEQQKHIGETIQTSIFGRMVSGKIIAVHPFGTVDIETESGNCFRVSGISL